MIIYGIASDIPTKSQWDGRAGRSTNTEAFCVQMIEPWVNEIDLSGIPIDPSDPDRPLSDAALTKKNPTKQERTGRASVRHSTSTECKRILQAEYYEDTSPEGAPSRLDGIPLILGASPSLHGSLVLRLVRSRS